MDTLRDILFRGFLLNDSQITPDPMTGAVGTGIDGSVVDSWDDSSVDIIQFQEKRAQQDGNDAGPPTKGARRIRLAGTLYGKTRLTLYDNYLALRAALDPVLSYLDSPADMGFQPLYFSIPTNRQDASVVANTGGQTVGYPSGAIDLRYLAMPRTEQLIWQRDQQGGKDTNGLAIPWQAAFILKDPSMMAQVPQDYNLGTVTGTVTGNLNNRGTYIAPLNFLIVVGAQAGTIAIQAGGAVNFTITVPASTGNRIIRFNGKEKVVSFEENSLESLRMGSFPVDAVLPQVVPGVSGWTVTFTGVTPQSGSHMWFYETYA